MKHSRDSLAVNRPVVSLVDEYPPGFVDPAHTHERSQLLYATAGVMSVITPGYSFVLPPQRALWLPAGTSHQVSCRGTVALRTLYIDSPHERHQAPHIIEVSDFLRALILEVVTFTPSYDVEGREGRIVDLLLEEIERMPSAPFHAPIPEDPKLREICRTLLDHPTDHRDLDDWAGLANMSRRTFTRQFKHQTGMSFALWRQQARLLVALSLLSSGQSVTTVAYDVGYESPSAFTAVFRRTFGLTPSEYIAQHEEEPAPEAS